MIGIAISDVAADADDAVAIAVQRTRPSAMKTMPSMSTITTAENGPK